MVTQQELIAELKRTDRMEFYLIVAATISTGSSFDERVETYASCVLTTWPDLVMEELVAKSRWYIFSSEFGAYPEQPNNNIG